LGRECLVLMYLLVPVANKKKKQLVDCIIFTLSGMDGLYSLRCNFPVHE
jgi:hypothetical protein